MLTKKQVPVPVTCTFTWQTSLMFHISQLGKISSLHIPDGQNAIKKIQGRTSLYVSSHPLRIVLWSKKYIYCMSKYAARRQYYHKFCNCVHVLVHLVILICFLLFRLRASCVLLVGIKGLGAEICKNLVLSGVKSVMIVDPSPVTEQDFVSQFLVQRQDLGKNVSYNHRTCVTTIYLQSLQLYNLHNYVIS